MCAIEHSGGRIMKRIWSLLLAMILILSMTACSKEESIMIQDTEMGKLEHQKVDVMGVTYDLFDSGYASMVSILHKDAQISEKVSYDGKEYTVVAVGFEWDTYNKEWQQRSVFSKTQYVPDNSPEKLVLPDTIKHVGSQAFRWCTSKQIILPSQITTLGGMVFEGCINLETIDFPDNLTTIGLAGMFGSCQSLKTVELPDDCEYPDYNILSSWFLDCYALESVNLPGDISIIEQTFSNCPELKEVILNEGIATIGECVFQDCPQITMLVIPESVTLIEGKTFYNCPNLVDITLPDGLSDVPANMFLDKYWQPADVSNLTIRVEKSMVDYVQSIYPTAKVIEK